MDSAAALSAEPTDDMAPERTLALIARDVPAYTTPIQYTKEAIQAAFAGEEIRIYKNRTDLAQITQHVRNNGDEMRILVTGGSINRDGNFNLADGIELMRVAEETGIPLRLMISSITPTDAEQAQLDELGVFFFPEDNRALFRIKDWLFRATNRNIRFGDDYGKPLAEGETNPEIGVPTSTTTSDASKKPDPEAAATKEAAEKQAISKQQIRAYLLPIGGRHSMQGRPWKTDPLYNFSGEQGNEIRDWLKGQAVPQDKANIAAVFLPSSVGIYGVHAGPNDQATLDTLARMYPGYPVIYLDSQTFSS